MACAVDFVIPGAAEVVLGRVRVPEVPPAGQAGHADAAQAERLATGGRLCPVLSASLCRPHEVDPAAGLHATRGPLQFSRLHAGLFRLSRPGA